MLLAIIVFVMRIYRLLEMKFWELVILEINAIRAVLEEFVHLIVLAGLAQMSVRLMEPISVALGAMCRFAKTMEILTAVWNGLTAILVMPDGHVLMANAFLVLGDVQINVQTGQGNVLEATDFRFAGIIQIAV